MFLGDVILNNGLVSDFSTWKCYKDDQRCEWAVVKNICIYNKNMYEIMSAETRRSKYSSSVVLSFSRGALAEKRKEIEAERCFH